VFSFNNNSVLNLRVATEGSLIDAMEVLDSNIHQAIESITTPIITSGGTVKVDLDDYKVLFSNPGHGIIINIQSLEDLQYLGPLKEFVGGSPSGALVNILMPEHDSGLTLGHVNKIMNDSLFESSTVILSIAESKTNKFQATFFFSGIARSAMGFFESPFKSPGSENNRVEELKRNEKFRIINSKVIALTRVA
jgi:cell division GTPase FtsZ